jgi:phytoene synthase
MNHIDEAYKQCEEIIRIHSATFYRAFSLLPSDQRRAVYAVYAFCRQVDEIVDEGSEPEKHLLEFEQRFEKFLQGTPDDDFLWVALRDVFSKYDMDTQAFRDMMTGQKMDLTITSYETVEDVLRYSYHVASSVGLMLLPVLAPGKQNILRQSAIELGYAMQLTNILRDVGEDLHRGRSYLPKELFEKFNYSKKSFSHYEVNDSFIQVWEDLAVRAEGFYESGLSLMHEYPLTSRIPLQASAVLYRAILQKIRKKGYSVFTEKNFLSDEEKEVLLKEIM